MTHHGHSVIWKTKKTAHGAVHGGRHLRTSQEKHGKTVAVLVPFFDLAVQTRRIRQIATVLRGERIEAAR